MGIKEIAKLAGVSIATVDRVLHNRGRVSIETREKIEAIIQQHNYQPNILARSLKTMQRKTIALLVPNPEEDEYWQQAWDGFESQRTRAGQQGVFLKPYLYSLRNISLFNKYSREIISSKPDGLIVAPNYLKEGRKLFQWCTDASVPVIMFDTIPPGTNPLCYIGTDSYQAGRLGAQLLGMITPPDGNLAIFHLDEVLANSPHMIEKERGFKAFLDQTGRRFSSIVVHKSVDFEKRLMPVFNRGNIAGVFVSTSKAYLVATFLKKQGIKGIKLVGFDLISGNIDLMKKGYIHFLINQNPGKQAEICLDTFIHFFVFGDKVIGEKHLPIEVITQENLTSYI